MISMKIKMFRQYPTCGIAIIFAPNCYFNKGTGTACTAISTPENGRMVTAGNTVTFTCDNGYLLIGYPAITCSSTGTWSQNAPTCVQGKLKYTTTLGQCAENYS